jgi:hypothetical protein
MNKILMAGALACLSAVAVAQSDQTKDKAPAQDQRATAREAASGQASGKRMHKPVTVTAEDSAREVSTGKATGKTMAQDDWHTSSAKTADPKTGNTQVRVATGDVNGDGVADANAKNSGHATETMTAAPASSNVTQPRDLATGQASGKRQHQPVTVSKESDAKSTKK